MAFDSGAKDLSGFKKTVTCDGQRYDEFSNFHMCRIWAEENYWPSSEHYYQALKFPGEPGNNIREAICQSSSPMESWQLGNSNKCLLREDWEVVKLDMMHKANFLKFSQASHLHSVLLSTKGLICCDGGLFWKTWNEIVLERVRAELREDAEKNNSGLAMRVALMEAYRSAMAAGDIRRADLITKWAAKRELPPESDVMPVTVSGLAGLAVTVLQCDMLQPEINGKPHRVDDEGLHLYLGKKNGKFAWVLDECCMASEATGLAFLEVESESADVPEGIRAWLVWDESARRHLTQELNVCAVI